MARMQTAQSPDLRFPVGRFDPHPAISEQQRREWIAEIAAAPARFREAVSGLNDSQLDTPYRPEGWTVRQVVHHVPDSHLNAYVRFKLALTEHEPHIRPYKEAEWAKLPDTQVTPISVSLELLSALHERWVNLLRAMNTSDFG